MLPRRPSDLTAAPKEAAFGALGGECLRCSTAARAHDVIAPMTSLPHLKNLLLQLLLGIACTVAVLQALLMLMSNDRTAAPEEFGFAALVGFCCMWSYLF